MMVAATPPRSSHPSNGVFLDRDRNCDARTRTLASGARIVTSAGLPGESEVARGVVKIRDLTEGKETEVPANQLVLAARELLGR